ncbi:MAG: hypothetical protein ABIS86_06995 [Streptosporangiaceae bacterium]
MNEIQRLRQGRGLRADGLDERTGPRLRALVEIDPGENDAVIRGKLARFFQRGCAGLPEDLARALLVSIGAADDAPERLLNERLLTLVSTNKSDRTGLRTAQRRMQEATRRFARSVERSPREPDEYYPGGWHLGSLMTFIQLDGPGIHVRQVREVVSSRDGLREFIVSTTIADGPEPPEFRVESGGRLIRTTEPAPGYLRAVIQLPKPLPSGARHRVTTSLHLPAGHPFGSRYLFQSQRRCDHLRVHLRLGPECGWDTVTPITGVPTGMIESDTAVPAPLDPFGEVEIEFTDLRPGLAYGVRWPQSRTGG